MSRPEFENQTLISAITNKTIVALTGETTSVLPAGTYERVTILSPKNTVSKLVNLRLKWAPATVATAGTKTCILDQQINDTQGIGLISFTGAFDREIAYDQGQYNAGVTVSSPSDLAAASTQIQSARFDEYKGIQFVFIHDCNANVSSKRDWRLVVEREVVAR